MKTFEATAPMRFRINEVLNSISGPIGRCRPLFPVLDQTMFSTDEQSGMKVTMVSEGVGRYDLPSPEYAAITVTLEDACATALASELENSSVLNMVDYRVWADALLKRLKES